MCIRRFFVRLSADIKFRVECVEVSGVEVILTYAKSFTKPLEMYDLTLSQELYGVTDIGIICKTQDIIVGRASFLFRSHVFMEVGENISL